jgi:hypothetical protein
MGCGASSPTGIRPARDTPSHADEVSRVVTQLREGSADARAQAAGVRKLANHLARHPDHHAEIMRAVPPLIALLHSAVREQPPHLVTARNIVSIIGNLACHADNKAAIVEAGAVPPLIKLLNLDPADQDIRLEVPTAKAQRWAAKALANLAQANAGNRVVIASAGAIPPLLALYMRERLQQPDLMCAAVGALATLAQNSDIQATIMAQCQQMGLDGLDIPEGFFSAEASRLEIRPAEGVSSPAAITTPPPALSAEQQQLEAAIQLSRASASAEEQARLQLAEQESRVLRESLSSSTLALPATQPPPPPPPQLLAGAAAAGATDDGTALALPWHMHAALASTHAALASTRPEHELTDLMALGFARQRALREKQHALEAQLRALVAEDPAAAL